MRSDRAAWAVAAGAVATLATQVAQRSTPRIVPVAQSLTPGLAIGAAAASLLAGVRRDIPLAVVGAAAACGLATIVRPALGSSRSQSTARPMSQPSLEPSLEPGFAPQPAPALAVIHANMLYENIVHADDAAAALGAIDADVLAMSELTNHHLRALRELGVEARYPHRFGRTHWRSEGVALWSRYPLNEVRIEPMVRRPGIVATVASPCGPVRIVLAHPDPPTGRTGLVHWVTSLRRIGAIGSEPGPPTLIVADLNASRWHPPLRALLAAGWRDAHESAGRGLSASWPCGPWRRPFVRLDHALAGPGIDVIDVQDVVVPGSDHRAFVVTIARTSAG
ncbi:MAG TPA: endonuclease/exonuclease/phosphatase family protein [Ilumatobacteraceae bacterium]